MANKDLFGEPLKPQPKEALPGFERWWSTWPRHQRKVGKAKCRERWKHDELEDMAPYVIEVTKAQVEVNGWPNQYTPAPLVWLNQKRWDCDIDDIRGEKDSVYDRMKQKGLI